MQAKVLVTIAGCSLLVQGLSATVQDRAFETPNAATALARRLVQDGEYTYGPLRAYHLPGEPLYLATGFAVVPQQFWRYLHVPVVALFVVSVAAVGCAIGGPRLGLVAGLVASLDPYVIAHGPIWDDTFLAAALDWLVFAILICVASQPAPGRGRIATTVMLGAIACAAGVAAITRTQSQLVLPLIAAAVLHRAGPGARRASAVAMLAGVVGALGMWGTRNLVTLGSFHVGSTRDGKALFESNCAYTRQGIVEFGVVGGFLEQCSEQQVRHAISLGEIGADRQLVRYAVEYIASHPGQFALTAGFKALISLTGFDFSSPSTSSRNVVAVASSLLLLVCGLYGLADLYGRYRRALRRPQVLEFFLALTVTALVTFAMLLVGPIGLRYRSAFAGFTYLGAAVFVLRAFSRARADAVRFVSVAAS